MTFLGRITYQKGPDYFVEAAAKVLKRVPDVRFVMAGSGDVMNHVHPSRGAVYGSPTVSTSRDSCAREDVHKMFQLSDVHVQCLRCRSRSASRPRGDAFERAGHHFETERRGRGAGLRREGRPPGRGCAWADAIYGLIKHPPSQACSLRKGSKRSPTSSWKTDAAAQDQIGLRSRDRRE
ncbi:MAG: glycosyltransferase [Alistipes finegoldii]